MLRAGVTGDLVFESSYVWPVDVDACGQDVQDGTIDFIFYRRDTVE